MNFSKRAALVLPMLLIAGPGLADPSGPPGHSHETFAAGEPGNPKQRARTVVVTMRDGNGTMTFIPEKIEVKRGEQIRFILTNIGALPHEFVLASAEENQKHAELMKKYPDMEHDDPNGKTLQPRAKSEILWRFTKAGEFEFACLIPGHKESGMHGKVIVK